MAPTKEMTQLVVNTAEIKQILVDCCADAGCRGTGATASNSASDSPAWTNMALTLGCLKAMYPMEFWGILLESLGNP